MVQNSKRSWAIWGFSPETLDQFILKPNARKVLMNKRNPLLQSHIASAIIKKSSKYAIHITLYTLFMILHTDSLNFGKFWGFWKDQMGA